MCTSKPIIGKRAPPSYLSLSNVYKGVSGLVTLRHKRMTVSDKHEETFILIIMMIVNIQYSTPYFSQIHIITKRTQARQ